MEDIIEFITTKQPFTELKDSLVSNLDLKSLSYFKTGGVSDFFFKPKSIKELVKGIQFFKSENIPISIIGATSNLLISDRGIRGVTIKLSEMNKVICYTEGDDVFVQADSGANTDSVSKFCADKGIGGFESFAGLPGTIGGAIFMNARCFNVSMSDIFFSANTVKINGSQITESVHKFKQSEWAYKVSPFQNNPYGVYLNNDREIVCSVIFKLKFGNKKKISNARKLNIDERVKKGHFKKPSAGSTFKNNRAFGKPSGQIIDELGLKGMSIGDALIAPWHGNFIVNNGNATANDIKSLIEVVRQKVKDRTGFDLETEVIFAGDWD